MRSLSPDSDHEEAWLHRQAIHRVRRRSVTDEELDKLRGCIDLGFSFDEVAFADVARAQRYRFRDHHLDSPLNFDFQRRMLKEQ
ncbi:hypothetical protein ZIOFF_061631 [Zingiber officinale]|uniref:Uncharacterized protein n=1 Tax=Zingiber officinale TaxID=94328 RepID=A0A8J5KCS3_ZINOF|nr:hypothetical protein ZIOFF_061631 [Zingiber officinale]